MQLNSKIKIYPLRFVFHLHFEKYINKVFAFHFHIQNMGRVGWANLKV
jgi:hypothetical protein